MKQKKNRRGQSIDVAKEPAAPKKVAVTAWCEQRCSASLFATEGCLQTQTAETKLSDLYSAYLSFCERAGIDNTLKRTAFAAKLVSFLDQTSASKFYRLVVKRWCAFNCGALAYRGRRLCKEHLDDQRLKMAQYRAERKKMMLCSRCPNLARKLPDGTASTLCEVCRAHVRALEAQQAEDRVS